MPSDNPRPCYKFGMLIHTLITKKLSSQPLQRNISILIISDSRGWTINFIL